MSHNPYEPGAPGPPPPKRGMHTGWKVVLWLLALFVGLPVVAVALFFGYCLLKAN